MASKYLTKKQTASYLAVSTKTIDRLRAAGELDWINVRSSVSVASASLQAYERRQQLHRPSSLDRFAIPALDQLRARARAESAQAAA